jgi:HK97 family phage prohead protease
MLALLNERDHAWDASAAKARVAKWASSDGSGDKDKISWSKYGRAFFVGSGEDFGDYHLPFADVFDGELKAVWKGVAAAANAASGGRGASGYGGAKGAIEKYYAAFRRLFKDDSIEAPWASDRALPEGWEEFTRSFGEFGGVERRYAHIANLETRDNGDPESLFSATGRAIVFNRYSLDLGGFKERITPEAVRDAMEAEDADYHLLWDHDTTLVLARNRNGTLKADIVLDDEEGNGGVDFWSRVAKTSYAADLRVLMDRKDIDECSFAFTVAPGGEEWELDDDGNITRTVTKIKRLWDLTICARGAYPDTQSASVRSFAAEAARVRGGDAATVLPIPTEDAAEGGVEDRALSPALVAWDAEQGYCDVACDLGCELNEAEADEYAMWWVIDVNVRDGGTEAIVCRSAPDGGEYFLIQGITYDSADEPVLPEGKTRVEEQYVAVPMSQDAEGGEAYEAYTALLAERHAAALSEIAARAHRAVDDRVNGAVTGAGGQGGDDSADVDDAENEEEVVDTDDEDNVEGHRPTTNDDENPTGIVDGYNGAVGEREEDDDEAEERDEEDDEVAVLRARARAKGRAALA